MGRLVEGEGQELVGLGLLDLETLLDRIHDGEFPGSGIEGRERSDREGRVDGVDPKCGRGPQMAAGRHMDRGSERSASGPCGAWGPSTTPSRRGRWPPMRWTSRKVVYPLGMGHTAGTNTWSWNRRSTGEDQFGSDATCPV